MRASLLLNVVVSVITLGASTPVFATSIKEDEKCPVDNKELCEVWELLKETAPSQERPWCIRTVDEETRKEMYKYLLNNLGKKVPVTPDMIFYNGEPLK